MHQGSENQRWGKALPPGATQAARWMLPAIVKWGCMSGVSSSHPRCKLLHWETAVGLNTLEWINQGMAAALCRSPGWVGAPALCAPRLHCSSCQPGFAPRHSISAPMEICGPGWFCQSPASLSVSGCVAGSSASCRHILHVWAACEMTSTDSLA